MFLTMTNPSISSRKNGFYMSIFYFFDSITLRAGEYPSDSSSWHRPPWPLKQIVLWLWTDGVTLPCLCLWSDLEMMAASCFNEWVRGRKCFAGSCMIWHTSKRGNWDYDDKWNGPATDSYDKVSKVQISQWRLPSSTLLLMHFLKCLDA